MAGALDVAGPAVVLENVRYSYPPLRPGAAPIEALRGVSLEVRRGELIAIAGPIGAGKSTLCQAIAGLVPHSWGGYFGGRVRVEDLDTRQVEPADLCRRVGLVFQDPETQLFNVTVEDEVAFGPESLGLPRDEIARRIEWALSAVHLSDLRHRAPRQLSGGQKQRLAIAAVLAMRPAILVLDEPTASLDPQGRLEVYSTIDRLRRDEGLTVVLVEQEADRIAESADRILLLREGRIVALGRPEEVLCQQLATGAGDFSLPAVAELAGRLRSREPDLPCFVAVADAEAALSSRLQPRSIDREIVGDVAIQRRDDPRVAQPCQRSTAIAEVRDVWYEYESGVQALRGVTLEVGRGERLAIVGQNGSGKTTLVKHLNGLLRPTRGVVLVGGENARSRSIGELAQHVGYVFQNPDHQIFAGTVWEELAIGPRQIGVPEAEVRERVDEAMGFFGLAPYRDEPPAALGYGLRRAVGLASVLTMRPDLLVLDEPFTGLDWPIIAATLPRLRKLADRGHAIVVVTHQMRAVAELAERVVVLEAGRVAWMGSPQDLFFREPGVLTRTGLARPQIAELSSRLAASGLDGRSLVVDELADDYWRARDLREPSSGLAGGGTRATHPSR